MMNKILPMLALMIFSGSTVFAEMRGLSLGMGMRYGPGLGFCADPELQLKPDQTEKIRLLQQRYIKDLREMQRSYLQKRYELGFIYSGKMEGNPEMNHRQKELQVLRGRMMEAWVNYKMECQALLSDEQLELLHQIEKRSGRRDSWVR